MRADELPPPREYKVIVKEEPRLHSCHHSASAAVLLLQPTGAGRGFHCSFRGGGAVLLAATITHDCCTRVAAEVDRRAGLGWPKVGSLADTPGLAEHDQVC